MHCLCITLRYFNKPNKPENNKVSFLLHFFNKTRALILSIGFRYFELQNIYKKFQIAQEFKYSVVSFFIDKGVGIVLSIWFVLALELNSKSFL